MLCWKCHKSLESFKGRLPFRASCIHCHAWLHVCINCKHYKRGLPNDCAVPDSEQVGDREKYNFCEDFSINSHIRTQISDLSKAAKKLFGDKTVILEKKSDASERFDSLFEE